MSEPRFRAGSDLLDGWRSDVLSGVPHPLYRAGDGELARIEIGPELVTLIGGAPGIGKSALVMQLICDALTFSPTIKALVCNVEMPVRVLLDRQLARLASIDLSLIRHRRLGPEHSEAIERGFEALERICKRLAFVSPPFNLANVAESADAFEADLLVLDYLQRIGPSGDHGDRRSAVSSMMGHLREFADAGQAVLLVSALARSRDTKGRSTYTEGLGLASYRESGEIEYGCDDAYLLVPSARAETDDRLTLKHAKSRHGETHDIELRFERKRQLFTTIGRANSETKARLDLREVLRDREGPAGSANGKGRH